MLPVQLLASQDVLDGLIIANKIQPGDVAEIYEMLIDHPGDFLGVLIEWDDD